MAILPCEERSKKPSCSRTKLATAQAGFEAWRKVSVADRAGMVRRAAEWLRPGGRVAVCAWLGVAGPEAELLVQAVGAGFLCPSFGTADDYRNWLRDAGLVERVYADLTPQVARTWEICERRVRASGVGLLARLAGRRMRSFVEHFATLGRAYRSGAMQYGLFVAEKPTC